MENDITFIHHYLIQIKVLTFNSLNIYWLKYKKNVT